MKIILINLLIDIGRNHEQYHSPLWAQKTPLGHEPLGHEPLGLELVAERLVVERLGARMAENKK